MKVATREKQSLRILLALLATSFLLWLVIKNLNTRIPTIGGTALVTENSTGLVFEALVDTGAGRCSIHYLELKIEDEAANPEQNIGKIAKVLVANEQDEQAWLETRLIDYSIIRNVEAARHRYHINLTLSVQGDQQEVSVTLKDRSHMKYRMLIGRNFLKDNFVVDVRIDSPDFPVNK